MCRILDQLFNKRWKTRALNSLKMNSSEPLALLGPPPLTQKHTEAPPTPLLHDCFQTMSVKDWGSSGYAACSPLGYGISLFWLFAKISQGLLRGTRFEWQARNFLGELQSSCGSLLFHPYVISEGGFSPDARMKKDRILGFFEDTEFWRSLAKTETCSACFASTCQAEFDQNPFLSYHAFPP